MSARKLQLTGLIQQLDAYGQCSGFDTTEIKSAISQLLELPIFKPSGFSFFRKQTPIISNKLLIQFVNQYHLTQTGIALQSYLLALKNTNCSLATIRNYRSDIAQFIIFSSARIISQLLTKTEVLKFLKFCLQQGQARNTIKRKISSIVQFCLWLQTQEALDPKLARIIQLTCSNPDRLIRSLEKQPIQNLNNINKPLDNQNKKFLWQLPLINANPSYTDTIGAKSNQQWRFAMQNAIAKLLTPNTKPNWSVYTNWAIGLLFLAALGIFGFRQWFEIANPTQAYPSILTRPSRTLSFQGRLTDTAKTPIVDATPLKFRLYDYGPTTDPGETLLWESGPCSVDPDQDGIFSVGLGDECGDEITENVFTENSNVWLEVEVDDEILTPRQSIKAVAYALNSETLQGYPPSATSGAVKNNVIVMDNSGQVLIAENNSVIKSTGASFAIEAVTLTLRTATGSNADITLDPDGAGKVQINSDLNLEGYLSAPGATLSAAYAGGTALVLKAGSSATADIAQWKTSTDTTLGVINSAGNLGIGTSDPGTAKFSVMGGNVGIGTTNPGYKLDILTSGSQVLEGLSVGYNTSHFVGLLPSVAGGSYNSIVQSNDSLLLYKGGGIVIAPHATGPSGIRLSSAGNVGINKALPSQALDVAGNASTSGWLQLAPNTPAYAGTCDSSAKGKQYFDGTTDYMYYCDGTNWISMNATAATGTNYWTLANQGLSPTNQSLNLYVGGNSTTSAKFRADANTGAGHFMSSVGIGTTSPTASLDVKGNALFGNSNAGRVSVGSDMFGDELGLLGDNDDSIAIRMVDGSYHYGGGTPGSGNLIVDALANVGIGTTSPLYKLDINGSLNIRGSSYGNETLFFGGDATIERVSGGGTIRFGDINALPSTVSLVTDGTDRLFIDTAGNVGVGTNNPVALLDVGLSGTTLGTLRLAGNTSGYVQIQPSAAAGSWTMTLPGNDGDNGQVLTTNGSGITSWASVSAGTNYWTLANQGLSPTNTTLNLYVGGDATASAKFIADGATGAGYFAGNVGIGTTNPGAALTVVTSSAVFDLRSDSGLGVYFGLTDTRVPNSTKTLRNYAGNFEIMNNAFTIGLLSLTDAGNLSIYGSGTFGTNAIINGAGNSYFNGGNVGIGTTAPGAKLDIGLAGSTLGTLRLAGNTSGYVQIQPSAAAGSWTMTLPANDGDTDQVLSTNGSGVLSWVDQASGSGTNYWTLANQGLSPTNTTLNLYAGGSSTASANFMANGASGGESFFMGNLGIGTTNSNQKLEVSGTSGTGLALTNTNGYLGYSTIDFYGYNNTSNIRRFAAIQGLVTGEDTVNGDIGALIFSTKPGIGDTTLTERMRIDYLGNIGIGTTNPLAQLEVYGASNKIRLATSSTNYSELYFDNTIHLNGSYTAGPTYDANIALAENGGNVGIGTTNPGVQLELTGDLKIGGDDLFMATNTSGMLLIADGTNFNPTAMSGDITIDSTGATAIGADKVALATDTTGNYVATIADAGNSKITVANSGSENAAITLDIAANSLVQGDIADLAIGAGELKTTTETLTASSTCNTTTAAYTNLTPAGNDYTFMPSLRRSATCTTGSSVSIEQLGRLVTSSTADYYVTAMRTPANNSGTVTAEIITRYIQATPPYYLDGVLIPHFIYILWHKDTGFIESVREAEDPVWESRGVDPDVRPHPFADYFDNPVPNNMEIAMINPANLNQWRKDAKSKNTSLATYLNLFMQVDTTSDSRPISPVTKKKIVIPGNGTVVWRDLIPQTKEKILDAEQSVANVQKKNATADFDNSERPIFNNDPSVPFLNTGSLVEPILAHANDPTVSEEKKDDLVLLKSNQPYSAKIIGVISEKMINNLPIVTNGRAQVWVSTINGAIKQGDPIVASEISGVGMLGTKAGTIVGRTVEDFDDSTARFFAHRVGTQWQINQITCSNNEICYPVGQVNAFINVTWYDPDVYITDTGVLSINTIEMPKQIGDTNSYYLSNNESLVDRIGLFAQLVVANIRAGLLDTQELIVGRKAKIKDLEVDKLAINEVPIDRYIEQAIDKQVNESTNTNFTQSTMLGELVAQNITVSESLLAPEIKAENIVTENIMAGGVTAETGEFALEVKTETIEAESARFQTLESKLAQVDEVTALTANLANATVSGTLYTQSIADLDKMIAEAFTKPKLNELFFAEKNQLSSDIDELTQLLASVSATGTQAAALDQSLADLALGEDEVVLTAAAAFIDQYFRVNGSAYVVDSLGVGQSLNIGQKVHLTEDYLAFESGNAESESLAIFQIQPSGKGVLSIMAGLMTLDETGLVTVTGNLAVAGDTTVGGSLLTDLLQPIDFGNPFQVQVAGASNNGGEIKQSRFEIVDADGAPVATISAQGRAEFAGGISVGNEDLSAQSLSGDSLLATESANLTTQKTSGRAVLPAGQTLLVIESTNITPSSLIYITPLGSTQNQVLYIASQQANEELPEKTDDNQTNVTTIPGHFSVAVDQALDSDLTFNWWIIN